MHIDERERERGFFVALVFEVSLEWRLFRPLGPSDPLLLLFFRSFLISTILALLSGSLHCEIITNGHLLRYDVLEKSEITVGNGSRQIIVRYLTPVFRLVKCTKN